MQVHLESFVRSISLENILVTVLGYLYQLARDKANGLEASEGNNETMKVENTPERQLPAGQFPLIPTVGANGEIFGA